MLIYLHSVLEETGISDMLSLSTVEGRKGNSNRNKHKVYRRTKVIKMIEIYKTGSTINRSQTLSL